MGIDKSVSRRDFLRASALGAAAIAVSACVDSVPQVATVTPQVPVDSTQAPASTPKGPVVVSYMYSNWRDVVHTGDTPIFKAWADPVGCQIDPMLQLKQDYDTNVMTRLMSDELPDLVEVMDRSIVDQYGPKGAFAGFDLDVITAKMPNVKRLWGIHPSMKAVMTNDTDGKVYGFPYISPSSGLGPWALHAISDEYMQKTGLDYREIVTLDDYTEMFRAIKALGSDGPDYVYAPQWVFSEEPDISNPTESFLATWGQCFRTAHRPFYSYDEKEYVYGPLMPEYQALVEYLRMLASEGMFFPEWYDMGKDKKKYMELAHQMPRRIGISSPTVSEMPSMTNRAQYWPLRAPVVDGKPGYYVASNTVLTTLKTWGISAKAKNIERVLELVDFAYSDRGGFAFHMGIEGETFERGQPPMDRVVREDFEGFEDGWWGYVTVDFGSWKWVNEPKWGRWESGVNTYLGIMRPEAVGTYVAHRHPLKGGGFYDANGKLMAMGEWGQPPEDWSEIRGPIMLPDDNNSIFDWSNYNTAAFFKNAAPESLMPAPPLVSFTSSELQELQKSLVPLNTFVDETTLAFILGNKPMSEWSGFLQAIERLNPGGILDVYNQALARSQAKLA